jgi:hypothetical protein
VDLMKTVIIASLAPNCSAYLVAPDYIPIPTPEPTPEPRPDPTPDPAAVLGTGNAWSPGRY